MADPTVSKVLVANRGEIALRIMRTCREMGIPTVAVFSEPDRGAPHVAFADERVELTGANPREAYLDIGQLIARATATGANAIHPGYGFLAENPGLPAACVEAGITFIGPSASSMDAMGDKLQARRRVRDVGVPVVPGTSALSDDQTASAEAERIGYPVVVKAAAGGGGIGMRVAKSVADLPAAIEGCRRAAKSSFGDDTVYLEKYLDHPRHIEMQVLADIHGTTLALGERDCSIQRRHQKLVEETPAIGLKPEPRAAMAAAAVRAAEAVAYHNAGTVEFIFSAGEFFFLEMNTRLQVEHPITEAVLGIDLVQEQIRIARGERLSADSVGPPRGHAIEFRINAEDPLRNFLPSPKTVRRYAPATGPGVRVDSGIHPHQAISPHFDPLLLKLIVWGADRDQAIARGRRALQEFVLTGPATTIPFHRALLEEPDFQAGRISTYFIQEHPSLLEHVRAHVAEHSPFEGLYGSPEVAAAIGAIIAVTETRA